MIHFTCMTVEGYQLKQHSTPHSTLAVLFFFFPRVKIAVQNNFKNFHKHSTSPFNRHETELNDMKIESCQEKPTTNSRYPEIFCSTPSDNTLNHLIPVARESFQLRQCLSIHLRQRISPFPILKNTDQNRISFQTKTRPKKGRC